MKTLLRLILTGLLFSGSILGATSAFGQAGSLDTTFGKGGKVTTSLGKNPSTGNPYSVYSVGDAILQPNGDIVVLVSNEVSFVLLRYLPNGSLDSTFGKGGIATTTFNTDALVLPYSLALQSNGQIIAAGGGEGVFAVERLNTNGTLDATFGTGGQVLTTFTTGLEATAHAVLVQPNGKILLAGVDTISGYHGGSTFPALARYNSNGTLDSTFGSGGTVVATGSDVATAIVGLDATGDIFVADYAGVSEFSPSGILDSAVTPSTITAASGHGAINAFYSNGEFLASDEVVVVKHQEDEEVVRYTATGAVDTTFNNSPFVFTGGGAPGYDYGGVTILSNGQIIVGGYYASGGFSTEVFGLARLDSNGSLDTTFGAGGTVTTSFQNDDTIEAVLIQTNGDIVAVGLTTNRSTAVGSLALARYLGN